MSVARPYNALMVRSIQAIYEKGVFRPTEPVGDLPEHAAVRLTVEPCRGKPPPRRALGLQRDKVIGISADFDAELGDDFWLGDQA